MKTRGLVLLLLSGWMSVSVGNRFILVSSPMTWTEAQLHCRKNFIDFATIADLNANTKAQKAGAGAKVWIGLVHGNWKWSEGRDISTNTWYNNWAWNEPSNKKCAIISDSGKWFAKDCGTNYYFSCYSAATRSHVLVKESMNWWDAQAFCRTNHTELSNITSSTDNTQIGNLLRQSAATDATDTDLYRFFFYWPTGGTTYVAPVLAWFGLYRTVHGWSDNSTASYRQWAYQQPNNTAECVMMDSSSAVWYTTSCDQKLPFLCQAEPESLSRKSLKIRLSGGSADMNNPAVQESIRKQLEQKLAEGSITGGIKLRWKTLPERKVFHREHKETAPPAAPMENNSCVESID